MKIRTHKIFLKLLRLIPLLCLCLGLENCFFQNSTHNDTFNDEGLLTARSDELKATVVSPHLRAELRPGINVLWCGSFQLAWNAAYTLIGDELHFEDEHPMVSVLNQQTFTKEALDESSFVALADFVRNNIHQQIRDALTQTFGEKASPQYIPSPNLTPRPQDIVAYAYLFKHLAFGHPFERLNKTLKFQGTRVPCFGIGEDYNSEQDNMYPQVRILDYEHADNFIIELQTTSSEDMLLLAKIPPEDTLRDTLRTFQGRIQQSSPIQAAPGDVLKVPQLNFDITRSYRELEGRRLIVENPELPKDAMIVSALQNIRFQMDELGVKLRSESHIALGCAVHYEPRPRYAMIFDKPFLILLKRASASMPYFAIWVGNPELLIH